VARRVADRHLGVGGDGLILVLPPETGVDADVRMRMFNADGSESEMCGNGVRCVCKLAHDEGLSRANPMRIQTGRGVLTLRYQTDAEGKVDLVEVDMGEPILEAEKIPARVPGFTANGRLVNVPAGPLVDALGPSKDATLSPGGVLGPWTAVSIGNPHVIFYVEDASAVPLERIGPPVEHARVFPRRINVHFVEVHSPGEVTMRTWERGSGITLACGTGASAVCVAGVLTGRTGRKILAHLPGGDLTLEWRERDNHVYMTGPATEVFRGEWAPEESRKPLAVGQ
jgi:diaminopimelate epimerase